MLIALFGGLCFGVPEYLLTSALINNLIGGEYLAMCLALSCAYLASFWIGFLVWSWRCRSNSGSASSAMNAPPSTKKERLKETERYLANLGVWFCGGQLLTFTLMVLIA